MKNRLSVMRQYPSGDAKFLGYYNFETRPDKDSLIELDNQDGIFIVTDVSDNGITVTLHEHKNKEKVS